MKLLKKVAPLTVAVCTLFTLSGCGEKKEENPVNQEYKNNPIATMQVEYQTAEGETKEGTVKIELYPNNAPETVKNFVNLSNNGFYDGLTFHRIVKDFMIQGGDPVNTGAGGANISDLDKSIEPGSEKDYSYSIKGEFSENDVKNKTKFEAGTIAMARSDYRQLQLTEEGYNSGSSQFFIMNTDDKEKCEYIEDSYAAFGKVIEGYDVILNLSNVEVKQNENTGENSSPVNPPIIRNIKVDTCGETYSLPTLINADETAKKVQERYLELMKQYSREYEQESEQEPEQESNQESNQ